MACSAAAQSPSVQVGFSLSCAYHLGCIKHSKPAAGSEKALISGYSVKSIHMVEPSHLPGCAGLGPTIDARDACCADGQS